MTDWHWEPTQPPCWGLGPEKLAYEDEKVRLVHRLGTHPDGRIHKFWVLDFCDWVQVVALTTNHEILLVSQFRAGINALTLELPGGGLNPNEDPQTGALRELQEETGYEGDCVISLGVYYHNPAMQNNRVHFFLCKNCRKLHDTHFDPDEELVVQKLPIYQLDSVLKKGKVIQHVCSLNGLLLFKACYLDKGLI